MASGVCNVPVCATVSVYVMWLCYFRLSWWQVGSCSVPVCATVKLQQLPVIRPLAALSVHQASREATAMKIWMNVTRTHVVPMLTAPTQLVPSDVTVMPATSNTTSRHVSVCMVTVVTWNILVWWCHCVHEQWWLVSVSNYAPFAIINK